MARKRRKRFHAAGDAARDPRGARRGGDAPVRITAFRYAADRCEERAVSASELSSLSPPEGGVLWLDVSGLSDPSAVRAIGDRFGIHSLALEDVLNVPQRPKVEWYGDHLLVVLREIRYPEVPEQMAFLLADRVSSPSRSARATRSTRSASAYGKERGGSAPRGPISSSTPCATPSSTPSSRRSSGWGTRWRKMEERLLVSPCRRRSSPSAA